MTRDFRAFTLALRAHPYVTTDMEDALYDAYDRLRDVQRVSDENQRKFGFLHWHVLLLVIKHETTLRGVLHERPSWRRWFPALEVAAFVARYACKTYQQPQGRVLYPFRPDDTRLLVACVHTFVRNGMWFDRVSQHPSLTTLRSKIERYDTLMRMLRSAVPGVYPPAFSERARPPSYRRSRSGPDAFLDRVPCALTQLIVDGFESIVPVLLRGSIPSEQRTLLIQTYARTHGFGRERIERVFLYMSARTSSLRRLRECMHRVTNGRERSNLDARDRRAFFATRSVLDVLLDDETHVAMNRQSMRLVYAVYTTFVLEAHWLRFLYERLSEQNHPDLRDPMFRWWFTGRRRSDPTARFLEAASYDARSDMVVGPGTTALVPEPYRSEPFFDRPNPPPSTRVHEVRNPNANDETWMNRVSDQPIPNTVANENRRNLSTFDRLERGVRLECGHWVSKAEFPMYARGLPRPNPTGRRGTERLPPKCPYCRRPIRKTFFFPSPRPRIEPA